MDLFAIQGICVSESKVNADYVNKIKMLCKKVSEIETPLKVSSDFAIAKPYW